MKLSDLMDKIGVQFRDEKLLEMALTHPSYGVEHNVPHYQRLEFLGDAVLELMVSRSLFFALPNESEGRLTRIRAALVREESLAEVAKAFSIPECIRLSVGEERSGGRKKPSIQSDVMEAVIGATYLDAGLDQAFALISRALGDRLVHPAIEDDPLDFKTKLQEILQQDGNATPTYEMLLAEGPQHLPSFTMRVLHDGVEIGRGSGQSKRAAQQEAARDALNRLHKG